MTLQCPQCGEKNASKLEELNERVLDCYENDHFIGNQIDHDMSCNSCGYRWIDIYPKPCESDDCDCCDG